MKMRDDLVIGPREKAREAIILGKTEEALRYLDEVYEQFRALHDSYGNNQCFFMGAIAEIKGEEWLAALDKNRVYEPNRANFIKFKGMPVEKRVKAICNNQRSHFNEFHVEEDDDKFVLVITNCNAGARLLRNGVAGRFKAVTKEAHPWSYNLAGFPYYCIHSYYWNELWKEIGLKMEIKWGRLYDEQGNLLNEPCRYIFYK
jgi:hypothetical protein